MSNQKLDKIRKKNKFIPEKMTDTETSEKAITDRRFKEAEDVYHEIYNFPGSNFNELTTLSGIGKINLNRIISWLEFTKMIRREGDFYYVDDES